MKKKIVFEGRTFPSRAALARELGVAYACLDGVIRRGVPLNREMFLKRRASPKEIKYGGQVFKNSGCLAKFLGIPTYLLKNRISMGWPEEKWADPPVKSIKVIYQGKSYDSIKSLATHLDVSVSTLYEKIGKGLPESQWLPEDLRISYKGQVFENKKELAKFLEVPHSVLCKRIQKGLPEEAWATGSLRGAGYCLADLPEEVQQMAISLADSLGTEPAEAYTLMVEEMV